jgi:hypothetical protein
VAGAGRARLEPPPLPPPPAVPLEPCPARARNGSTRCRAVSATSSSQYPRSWTWRPSTSWAGCGGRGGEGGDGPAARLQLQCRYFPQLVRDAKEGAFFNACLATLGQGRAILLIDYKMKVESEEHRERQGDFFGKSG